MNLIRHLLLAALLLGHSAVFAVDICIDDMGCRRFTGVGLGVVRDDDRRPDNVKQLVAIRAAKLEAVRSLAEQIHGIKVTSKSDLTSSQLLSDRSSMETFAVLHGVRFVKVEPIQPGVYQALAEVDYYQSSAPEKAATNLPSFLN